MSRGGRSESAGTALSESNCPPKTTLSRAGSGETARTP